MIIILKYIKKILLSRSLITIVLLLVQVLFYALIVNELNEYSGIIHAISYLFSFLLAIYVLSMKNETLDIKLPWVILILTFPVFGSLFYFLFHQQKVRKKIRKNIESQAYSTKNVNYCNDSTLASLKKEDKRMYNQSNYIYQTTNLPVYQNTSVTYFKEGEEYFASLVEEIKKAQHYVFIEYFIIKQGKMWNTILNVLKEKAAKGIEVRVLYDDFGCITSLPIHYKKHLEKYHIKCQVFNPIKPVVTLTHNNRDHRKIVVIDGKVAFTGGINLADEYINEVIRFGHWKDTGIMLKGEAVRSFILMFLENWHIYQDKEEDYAIFWENKQDTSSLAKESKGQAFSSFKKERAYIQPYIGSPLDANEPVARNVYIHILNDATDYVYITTPYLILDQELENALISAAKRGVDVRIITPHIPDKKYVYVVTRSNYPSLLKAGVSIFEYTPGFIHAKNVCADDKIATVGSINFDNRSFYHSYECGVWLYQSEAVLQIKEDFLRTQEISLPILKNFVDKIPISKRLETGIWRIFSPLL